MKFMKSCQNIQALIYAQEDRTLTLGERASKFTHFLICKSCQQVQTNVVTLRDGLKAWRGYKGD
jgi:hypothetical protein